jgi:hypothetical protein
MQRTVHFPRNAPGNDSRPCSRRWCRRDNEPQLAAPYAVVYSDIVGFQGINPIYEFHRSVRLFRVPLNSETLLKSWNLT